MLVAPLYLLDTNILIHAARGNATWEEIKRICNPLVVDPCPIYSFVTEAEILSFAEQLGWGNARRREVSHILRQFSRISIEDKAITDAYIAIDVYSRRYKSGSIRMGKNDLWIAATAYAMNATIVTTDKDFDHLHGTLVNRILIEQPTTDNDSSDI